MARVAPRALPSPGESRRAAHWCAALLCALLTSLACIAPAMAQNRAWFDRDTVALDDTVVLNVEIEDTRGSGLPDMSAINRDFVVVDQDVGTEVYLDRGIFNMRATFRLTLRPMREGEIVLAPIRVGRGTTPPLRLTVLPPRKPPPDFAAPPPTPGGRLPAVFIDSRLETTTPYVQQSVGYTVRLFYDFNTLLDGRLDQDTPDGAALQKLSDERQTTQQIGDRLYHVVERRYLLIPERGGALEIPAPRFLGRSSDPFGGLFGGMRNDVRVSGRASVLQVRPIPAGARQPWLPLRGLQVRYLEAPTALQVGRSARVTVEAVADGAVVAQMPALTVIVGDGAQVFAEPVKSQDDFGNDRARATVRRSFEILPSREGTLRIAGPRIDWWDAEAGVARNATLPDLVLTVGPPGADAKAGATGAAPPAGADDRDADAGDPWMWMMALLALLWIATLGLIGWLWSTRRMRTAAAGGPSPKSSRRRARANTGAGTSARPDATAWSRALARGDRGEIARLLCAMAPQPAADLDGVLVQLDEPAQRAALIELQRARWGHGDAYAAVAGMRTAFADGPHWRGAPDSAAAPPLLAPLYPQH